MGRDVMYVSRTPDFTTIVFDHMGAHIPTKIKENIWAGEYIDLYISLKSTKDLTGDPHQKQTPLTNIHVRTLEFMTFMRVMSKNGLTRNRSIGYHISTFIMGDY